MGVGEHQDSTDHSWGQCLCLLLVQCPLAAPKSGQNQVASPCTHLGLVPQSQLPLCCLCPQSEGNLPLKNTGTCSPLQGGRKRQNTSRRKVMVVFSPPSPTTICISLSVPPWRVGEFPTGCPAPALTPSCILPRAPGSKQDEEQEDFEV